MTYLDSILKRRDITLSTKIHLVKAMVYPVVMYGCESWIIKKAECWRINAFELWCWRRLLRVPWTARRSNQSILKEISPGCWNQPRSEYLAPGNCKCYNQGLTYCSVDCLDLQKWRGKCKPCQLDECVVSIVTELWMAQNIEKMVFQHTKVPDAALLSIQRLNITQKQYIFALDEKTSSCFVFIFFPAGYIRKIRSDMDKILKNMYFLHVCV